jgi:hypothetical protein
MSDRPIHHEVDIDAEVPAPARVGAGMRVTQEQLAAAERTRDYHLRRLQSAITGSDHGGETGVHREH